MPASWSAVNYFDPPKRLVWALLALILAMAGLRNTKDKYRHPAIPAAAFALFLWILLRTLLRPHPVVELEVLASWLMPPALFMLGAGFKQPVNLKLLAAILLPAALLQGGLMIAQYLGHDPLFAETTGSMVYKPGRMIGTIGYQNQAVDFLALCSILVLFCASSGALRFLVFAASLTVAALTANRGGILALVIAIPLSLACLPAGRQTGCRKLMAFAVAAVSLLAVMFAVSLFPATGDRFREALTDIRHSPAFQTRLRMAEVGVNMWKEKPFTGWGAGEYAFQYLDRLRPVLPEEKTHEVLRTTEFAREAHNDLLQFTAEFGLVGVALLGILLVLVIRSLVRAQPRYPLPVSAAVFVLAYMAVAGLVSFPWQTSMAGPLAGFLLGLFVSCSIPPAQKQNSDGSDNFRKPAALAYLFVFVPVTLLMLAWYAEDAFLNTAVPETLRSGGPAHAQRFVPSFAYRYHALIGATYAGGGNYPEAEKELLHARSGYRDVLLFNSLGHTLAKLGKWNEAREIYKARVESGIGFNYPQALADLSVACEQFSDYAGAVAALERKQALWPNESAAEIKRLAVLQLKIGNAGAALRTVLQYEDKCGIDPAMETAEMDNLAGAIYSVLGRRAEAEERLHSALKKNPQLESARRNLESLTQASHRTNN